MGVIKYDDLGLLDFFNKINQFMKTKVTLFLLLLFAMGGSLFAQVQIKVPSSYQPATLEQGGAPGTYKVDIVNNNAAALSGTFSLELPTGMEYIAGSIAGGGVESNIGNLQRPDFSISIPSGNTLSLTFSARINCGFVNSSIVYQVIVNSANAATAVSDVAANTPASAYVFLQVPSPQALSTPLSTNATRTIKFKNTGNVAVNTVYFESNVVTAAQYPYYKLLSASNGTIAPVTNGYRITLTGAALQSAITTSVGAANASFDKDEEITLVLTEQMTSCAAGSTINLSMKAGSGDTKNSFCFFDSSTASITTPVSNAAISITRLTGTTYPTFCDNGKVSYTIKNEGSGTASSLYNVKFPWSMNYSNSGQTPSFVPFSINIKKVLLNGNDVTNLVMTRNGTGATALIPGIGNSVVINLAGLTSAYGTTLQSLDGDGKFDDLLAGQSFQLDFEYGLDTASYKTCSLHSQTLPSTSENYFSIGTSFADQCGTRTNKTNYISGVISVNTAPTFLVGSQQYNTFTASLSTAALNPGDKATLYATFTGGLTAVLQQSGKILKTFTIVLPDGLDYDSTEDLRYMNPATTGTIMPKTAITYNAATKTLVLAPPSTFTVINAANDNFQIPIVASITSGTNKTLQYSSTFGFTGCGITMPYGCSSTAINYAVIGGGPACPTVETKGFDMTRATFGYVPAPSNTNVWYTPTAYVDENTAGINLHGAVSKDKVKTTFKGVVNSTSFSELWARVKYKSQNASNLTLSNFDKGSADPNYVMGTITITKVSDGSTVSGNITVGDMVFSYDSATSLQLQQVNLGAKIGTGKDINYTLQVGDQIAVTWFTKVTRDNLSYTYSQLENLEGDFYTKDAGGTLSNCQPIPVGFAIQRLLLSFNSNSGTQAVVGTNSLRIISSVLNGGSAADISGDHFPNEVRNYGVFRNVIATIPGIWVLDTAVGKEPYCFTSNNVTQYYGLDKSKFLVTYSGGNTIVTYNNSALGSNGMPLATANIPVIADWIGANGSASVSFYMLPVCAASGALSINTVQSWDIYTTAADNSNTESSPATFNQGTASVVYNYSANAAPTLQNVDGIGSTVNWQVRVTNTSDTAAIVAAGGGASLPNNWMSFESPNNNITVTKLTDIVTGTVYPVVDYGTGKYWVKLGDIATTATYNVTATYTTCVDDKLQFTYNFGSTGYPIDPVQGYGGGLGTCAGT